MNNLVAEELALGDKLSIIRLVNEIITEAYNLRASDVHIDPQHNNLRIRYRIDGALRDAYFFPKNIHAEIISRIKILAALRTDEHQQPQDGRFRLNLPDQTCLDVRVSVAPTYHGENAVFRLLSDKGLEFTLESLDFSPENLNQIKAALKKPYGMILATGPTGSGKTTTLYTLIKILNTKESAIVAIEDPIEYAVDGIEQIQANPRAGLSFANGLRSILRQDPNIIMVGEIRDAETAGIAVNTALTGHLLLSSLHTSDAATTLPRLLDMKIESYLIASTVNLIIGQRLMRKICRHCKIQKPLSETEYASLKNVLPLVKNKKDLQSFRGQGCDNCSHTGYFGRLGVHEVLTPNTALREAVLVKAPAGEIKRLAVLGGMKTMLYDAWTKSQAGLTSITEVLRMLYE